MGLISLPGGGAAGAAKLPFPILGPGATPTRSDWEKRGLQWTGDHTNRIVRHLIGDHGAIARFATFSTTDGQEIREELGVPTSTEITQMRNRLKTGDKLSAVEWSGLLVQDWKVGDLVYKVAAGTLYWCTSDHSNAANREPGTDGGSAHWWEHQTASAPSASSFKGVYASRDEAVASGNFSDSGSWFVSTESNRASAYRRHISPDGWGPAQLGAAILDPIIYAQNEDTYGEIRLFNSSQPQLFVIDGNLKQLVFWDGPDAGNEVFTTELADELPANILLRLELGDPNEEKFGQIRQAKNGDLFECKGHWAEKPTVTWTTYSNGSDVGDLWGLAADAYRWRGSHDSFLDVSSPGDDDVACIRGGFWRYDALAAHPGWYQLSFPQNWFRFFANQTDAEHGVNATDQVVIAGNRLQVVQSYTAGSGQAFHWERVAGAGSGSGTSTVDGSPPDSTILLDNWEYDQSTGSNGWLEVTLAADLEAGRWLEVRLDDDYGSNATESERGGKTGYILSDAITSLTEEHSAAPTSIAPTHVRQMYVPNVDDDGWGHSAVWLAKSDESNKLWFRHGRDTDARVTIVAYPRGIDDQDVNTGSAQSGQEASEQAGVTGQGARVVTIVLSKWAESKPTTFPTMNAEGVISDYDGWADIPGTSGNQAATLWLGFRRCFLNSSDEWANGGATIVPSAGNAQYRAPGGAWHFEPVQSSDRKIRIRTIDGWSQEWNLPGFDDHYSVADLTGWLATFNTQTNQGSSHTIAGIPDIDDYDALLVEQFLFQEGSTNTGFASSSAAPENANIATSIKNAIVFRPAEGWSVNTKDRGWRIMYDAETFSLHLAEQGEDLDNDSWPSDRGTGHTAADCRRRMRLWLTDSARSGAQRGGAVDGISCDAYPGTYRRRMTRIRGLRFDTPR
ncbi:MAG: hypothetical protein F4X59_17475 [Holophagales bacterium]|nr:hypothetical protein [Holophagales bacterium]MYC11897.1 hypothetical protein [Holophagales bacterium]